MDSRRTVTTRMAGAALAVAVLAVGAATVPDAGTIAERSRTGTGSSGGACGARSREGAASTHVVLITTDDMRADDLAYMPQTRRLLGRLDLTEFVSNHPLCCPARAQLLTGQLAQHNGVLTNPGPDWGGYSALRGKNNTVARWFRRSGYATALVGKFINGWCPAEKRPAGWTDFLPLVKNAYSAYHYSYFDNTRTRRAPKGVHTNDFVTTRTLGRIRDYAPGRRPFFVWSSYVAPHDMSRTATFGPPVPAKRHEGTMAGVIPFSESVEALLRGKVRPPEGRSWSRPGLVGLRPRPPVPRGRCAPSDGPRGEPGKGGVAAVGRRGCRAHGAEAASTWEAAADDHRVHLRQRLPAG